MLAKIIPYLLIIFLLWEIIYCLPNKEEVVSRQEKFSEKQNSKKSTPNPDPILESDSERKLINQILLSLEDWKNTAPKKTKIAIDKTIKSLNNPFSDLIYQILDLEHLLTHYGQEQTQLVTLVTELKALTTK